MKLTAAQKETLAIWEDETRFAPDGFHHVHHIFSARNNRDNGKRRIMYHLIEKGLLATLETRAGCIPAVKGGNPLKTAAPQEQREECIDCGSLNPSHHCSPWCDDPGCSICRNIRRFGTEEVA